MKRFTACASSAEGNAVFEDCNGYEALPQHLGAVGLTLPEVIDCISKFCPLGMTLPQFTDFKTTLAAALAKEKLNVNNCDVRLKGSSAGFYSGWHKLMPRDRGALHNAFVDVNHRVPKNWELNDIEIRFNALYPDFLKPIRRPFDTMKKIGIQFDLSDYDIQVSSDEVETRIRARAASLGGVPDLIQRKGKFFKKSVVELEFPELAIQWPTSQGNTLGRGVTVACFGAAGPPNDTADLGHLSSHFRPADWIL